MSNAPYLLPKARAGYRMGHQQVLDHMFLDGLEDAYDKGRLMGSFAEDCADEVQLHARRAGCIRSGVAAARAESQSGRLVCLGDRAGRAQVRQGRSFRRQGRAAVQSQLRQDPAVEARLSQGRYGHGSQLQLDFRRRRCAGADAALDGAGTRPASRWRRSSAIPRMRRNRAGSPPHRSARSASSTRKPAGVPPMSICTRSTKRSRWSRSRR